MTTPQDQIAAAFNSPPFVAREIAGGDLQADRPAPRDAAWDADETPANDDGWAAFDDGASLDGIGPYDPDIIKACAGLDHSDTDNAERLMRHFGQDLSVLAQEGTTGGDWLTWTGTHWDRDGGAAGALLIAQKLGGLIALEAEHLSYTPDEARAVAAARGLEGQAPDDLSGEDKRLAAAAQKARAALDKRKARRRNHGMTSKNKGRMEAALHCAAPRLRRAADLYNPNRHRFATLTHTVTLGRAEDLECPDPDVRRFKGTIDAVAGHDRADWITSVVPIAWREDAKAESWRAFLKRMLPDESKRRTVQQFSGLGLLGIPVQYIMFHYGLGANGKSVFLETLVRLLGPGLAVGLPRESIVGGSDRSSGGASPDLARLYGKRMVRILEVKGNVPLQEDLIKRLTGGEAFPVRTLFKGYFEFQSIATPHMSGNGKPSIDGTDNGIWRRMLLVHWDQTIPEHERGDFEEVVSRFISEEGEGILTWLVEGVLDYLANGLVIAPSVVGDTQEYRDEMDPIGMFASAMLRPEPGGRVPAGEMYTRYVEWSNANGKKAATLTKFGRVMGERHHKSEITGRVYYHDVTLLPPPEEADGIPRTPYAEPRG